MLNSVQHPVKVFSAFGRHPFHPRPEDGVFRCDPNKRITDAWHQFFPHVVKQDPTFTLTQAFILRRHFYINSIHEKGLFNPHWIWYI